MVQILPSRGFGAGFTEAFPEAFKESSSKYLQNKAEEQKAMLQMERDRSKIMEQEAAKQREFARFAQLLGIELPQGQDEDQQNDMSQLLGQDPSQQEIPPQGLPEAGMQQSPQFSQEQQQGEFWEKLNPNKKAMFALRYPQAASQMQKDLELSQKNKRQKEESERKPIEKSVEGFFTKLGEDAEKLPQLELSVDSMIESILSGEVDPFSSAHLGEIANSLGVPQEITRILETPGSKQFKSARKQFLSSTLKEAFRGATTGREIELAESLLAELGTKPEANLAAAFLIQSDLLIRKEKQRLAAEAEEKGISNYQIPKYVNKNIESFRKDVHKDYMDTVKELRRRAGVK